MPGFPQHPHRGFETVTYVRTGLIDHSDSLGAAGRFGRGDVQWLTAGGGIVHCEMFPLLDRDGPNPLELFQIWLNLPAADKMVDPYFTMLWDDDIPQVATVDDDGRRVEITVIAGALDGSRPAAAAAELVGAHGRRPTSRSGTCASSPARVDPPAGRAAPTPSARSTCSTASGARSAGTTTRRATPARCCDCDEPVELVAGEGGAEVLVLQGRPIGEPVAQYGPFVMNDRGRDRAGLRRLPAHRLRRLAVAGRRPGARPPTRAASPATPTAGSSSKSTPALRCAHGLREPRQRPGCASRASASG